MQFQYKARTKNGDLKKGIVEASSQDAAFQIISRQGLYITSLEEAKGPLLGKFKVKVPFLQSVSVKEVLLFSRQLSIMFRAKVSLVEALNAIGEQASNPRFREHILRMAEEVEGGSSFSQALSRYPSLFSNFYVSMVKRGEVLGKLSDVLDYLADHLEREYELRGKVKSAMTYPAFVIFVAVVVVGLLMVMVIPNLVRVLEQSGQELPLTTRIVIGTSEFLRSWILVILVGVGGAIVAVTQYAKTPRGKAVLDRLVLQIPVVGTFLRTVYLSRFGENLATLITGGVPFIQALDITAGIIGNTVYKKIIGEAKRSVEEGIPVSEVLKKYPKEFPPIFTQMVVVGEKSGTLDSTLLSIVQFYRKEVDRAIDAFIDLLEPALIVFLGVVVGGLMASIILPLYQITSTL